MSNSLDDLLARLRRVQAELASIGTALELVATPRPPPPTGVVSSTLPTLMPTTRIVLVCGGSRSQRGLLIGALCDRYAPAGITESPLRSGTGINQFNVKKAAVWVDDQAEQFARDTRIFINANRSCSYNRDHVVATGIQAIVFVRQTVLDDCSIRWRSPRLDDAWLPDEEGVWRP